MIQENSQNRFTGKVQDYYSTQINLVSSPFTNLDQINIKLLNSVFSRLDIRLSQKRILDVGCGGGMFSQYCKDRGGDYSGMDITYLNLERASRFDSGRLAQADSQQLPFRSQSFDILSVIDSFEHFPQPDLAVNEFRRVLKPGGAIFLSVPNYLNVAGLVKKASEKCGGWKPDSWAPFDFWEPQVYEHFLTPLKVKALFKQAGFLHYKMISLSQDYYVAMLPWAWHPKCPGKLARLIELGQRPFGFLFSRFLPWFGLHNIWKIS